MSDVAQFPVIPKRSLSPGEHLRRHSDESRFLLGHVDSLTDRVALLEQFIVELTVAGYGGGVQNATVPNFDVLGVYTTLPFDTLSPAVSRGVTFTPATNNFVFTVAGPWQITMTFNIAGYASLNAARSFTMRLYNENLAAPGGGVVIGIGRNTEDSLVSVSAIFDITQADVDNGYSFHNEVGNASTNIIGGDLTANAIQAVFVGELGSLV